MIHRRCGSYVGIDPTAPSLHIGHMVPLMALGWLYVHGYPISFVVCLLLCLEITNLTKVARRCYRQDR